MSSVNTPASPHDADPNRWVGVSELSARGLGSPWTLRDQAREGLIPAVKIGGQWRIRIGDIPRPATEPSPALPSNETVCPAEVLGTLSTSERRAARRALESLLLLVS